MHASASPDDSSLTLHVGPSEVGASPRADDGVGDASSESPFTVNNPFQPCESACPADAMNCADGFCGADGACTCDAAWAGPACSTMALLPAQRTSGLRQLNVAPGGAPGTLSGNTSTWGGATLYDPKCTSAPFPALPPHRPRQSL